MYVSLRRSARKDLVKIGKGDGRAAEHIHAFLEELENVPDPRKLPNAKKLKGIKDGWRFRVGEYRIETRIIKGKDGREFADVTQIADDEEFVDVHKIGPRQEAYKN